MDTLNLKKIKKFFCSAFSHLQNKKTAYSGKRNKRLAYIALYFIFEKEMTTKQYAL